MIFDSLEGLMRILFRCDIYEQLYTKRNLQATKQLNTSLIKLYITILNYLCSARRQLSLNSTGNCMTRKRTEIENGVLTLDLARMLKSVLSDSGELFRNIQECEKEVQKDVDMADKEGLSPSVQFISGPADPQIAVALGSDGMNLATIMFKPFDLPRPNYWIEQVEATHDLKLLLIEMQEPIQDIARIVDNINKTVESKFFGTLGPRFLLLDLLASEHTT